MQAGFVSLSAIDEERFGVKTAKALRLQAKDISDIMNFCKMQNVEFLIVRCPTTDLTATQELEQLGFLLMDTLVYYSCNLKRINFPDKSFDFLIRPVNPGEEYSVKSLATEIFTGYSGHYHADSRLNKKKCDEIYPDWAYKSCKSKVGANEVLVAVSGKKIIGFGTICVNGPVEGEGMLFGVSPSFRGKGVYRAIMIECLKWCMERRLERMIISTQITNLASQKTWISLGFEPYQSFYTFHKWFSSTETEGSKSL